MPERVDTLLVGGVVVTMNEEYDVHSPGAVAIKGDGVAAVGDADHISESYQADEIIDCQGSVIIPGLVNAHTHVPMTLLRGLNDDLRLDVWLGYLMPLEREFVTPDFVYLGTQLACAEMIRSGVTTFADMYYFEDMVAQATAEIGMRGLLGQTILIFPSPDSESYEEGLILCRRFIEKWIDHPLIQPAVAPHAWYTATPELMQACADLARGCNVPLHTHIAETALEVENCREDHHMPVVPWLSNQGILGTKLLAAHCVHIDQGEMYQLEKAGAGVAHCPTSNLKLASGIAQVAEMLEAGLNVGVGTDGPASNNDLDMFEEMRLAALLAKTASNDPTTLPARKALEMATIGGAKALHMDDKVGSLEPGKKADLVVIDASHLHNWPHFHNHSDTVYSRLVYASKSSDVTDVVCNGRWLLRDGQLLTVDQDQVKKKAAERAHLIDDFVIERESSPFNKLVLLKGVQRQESFEIQVKAPLLDDGQILELITGNNITITKKSHYRQYDNYFFFNSGDPDAARLRYREDEFIDEDNKAYEARSRLTLLGEAHEQEYPNAVMLYRSRYLAPADRSLRFYREYFDPSDEVEVHKDRRRWRITYKGTDFAVNIDQVSIPEMEGLFLEIKSRTWSRSDAERKARLINELLKLFGVDPSTCVTQGYAQIAQAKTN